MTTLDRVRHVASRTPSLELLVLFGSRVAHPYESLDMRRVHEAAVRGPSDLIAFLACLRDRSRAS